jgi:cytochrome P450
MDGAPWKHWRTIFNRGFSAKHILNFLPEILNEVLIFKERIRCHAQKNDIILFGEPALKMMIDVTSRVVLGHQFNSQTVYNEMMSALQSQLKWCSAGISSNVLDYLNVFRLLAHCYNSRRMNRYISRVLLERHKSGVECQPIKHKYIVDLALQEDAACDETSKEVLVSNIKLFLLAGYDTTAATTVYLFYLISLHPDVTACLRAEHTAVFGTDTQTTPSLLLSSAQLLNQLPLTLTVIKETLRLYPAASTVREAEPDFYLVDDTGCPASSTEVRGMGQSPWSSS